jgi:beta-glucanase (GH16 family)
MVMLWSCGGSDDDPGNGGNETPGIDIPSGGATSPTSYDGMTLVWEENFEGEQLDPASWSHEIGTGSNGWGNNELQYYKKENTSLQDGYLIITAKEERVQDSPYTSSRIVSMNKKSFQYGRIDIRAALPQGQGMWPALWMLGDNFSSVGWPRCGEIDIMEMVGGQGRENEIHGTVHWDNGGQYASYGQSTSLASGQAQNEFNIYSIEWTATEIRWLVNGSQYNVIDTQPAGLSEFRDDFFFIMNLAVGGNWPGSPDASTSFPQHFIVDYIRVFQEN